MSDVTIDHATDTWADEGRPGSNFASGAAIGLKDGAGSRRWGYLKPTMDPNLLLGRTVLSATLTGHIRVAGAPAQTVTVNMLGEQANLYALNWNNRPSAVLPLATGSIPAGTAVGDSFTVDVTALAQAVADGQEWHGFRLSTDSTTPLWLQAQQSGEPAWLLEIDLSEAPEQPTNLRPDGGAVGTERPVLAWDGDGDGVIPQAAFRVKVYDSEAAVTPVHDSGWIESPDPEYDLGPTTYVAVPTPYWTVQTRSTAGVESEVSDRAWWTYVAMPSLIIDTPTGGVIGDPTPPIAAHLSSGTLRGWRVRITGGNRANVRYDSGFRGGPIDFTLPRRHEGRLVLRDERPSWMHVRAFDDVERAGAVGQPTYVEEWVKLEWDDDAGVTAPTNLSVTQYAPGDARLVWQWECAVQPEGAWLLQVDGRTAVRVDADEVTPNGGVYTYTDQGQVPPLRQLTLSVRATNATGKRSTATRLTHRHVVEGFAIIPLDGGEPIVLDGVDIEGIAAEDHFDRYVMQDGSTMDILYGRGVLTGSLGLSTEGPDAFDILDRFDALTPDATSIPRARLVWGSRSIRARLLSPHHVPDPAILPFNNLHQVRLNFVQED